MLPDLDQSTCRLDREHDTKVDRSDRVRVVVQQAHQAELWLPVRLELLHPFAVQADHERVIAFVDRVEVAAHPNARLAMESCVAAGVRALHQKDAVAVADDDVRDQLLPLRGLLGDRPIEVAPVLKHRLTQFERLRVVCRTDTGEVTPARNAVARDDEDVFDHQASLSVEMLCRFSELPPHARCAARLPKYSPKHCTPPHRHYRGFHLRLERRRRSAIGRALRIRRERGQSLVEFALILPILLLLVGGIIQYGVLFATKHSLIQVGRDVGRWAATQNVDAAGDPLVACDDLATDTPPQPVAQADLIALQSHLIGYADDDWRAANFVAYADNTTLPASPPNTQGVEVVWSYAVGEPCPTIDSTDVAWVTVRLTHRAPVLLPGLAFLPGIGTCDSNGCYLVQTTTARFRMEASATP
jgi:Flp pilus assembly protein TadG